MQVQTYLFFDGRAEEAIEFYKSTLGAKVGMLMRFKDNPDAASQPGCNPAGADDKIMHAEIKIGDTTLMASDGNCTGKPSFQGFALTAEAKNPADAERLFAKLGDGGNVVMPMGKTIFSPAFGMVADRFGVTWMVIVPQ